MRPRASSNRTQDWWGRRRPRRGTDRSEPPGRRPARPLLSGPGRVYARGRGRRPAIRHARTGCWLRPTYPRGSAHRPIRPSLPHCAAGRPAPCGRLPRHPPSCRRALRCRQAGPHWPWSASCPSNGAAAAPPPHTGHGSSARRPARIGPGSGGHRRHRLVPPAAFFVPVPSISPGTYPPLSDRAESPAEAGPSHHRPGADAAEPAPARTSNRDRSG